MQCTRWGLPSITGFIATGVVCGPYVLNIVEQIDLPALSYINMFALAYITTSAGAELVIHELMPSLSLIVASVTTISLLTFGACTGVVIAFSDTALLSTLMVGLEDACQSSISLVSLSCLDSLSLSASLHLSHTSFNVSLYALAQRLRVSHLTLYRSIMFWVFLAVI